MKRLSVSAPGSARRRGLCALALAGIAPLPGCALLAPPAPPPQRGLLTEVPADVPQAEGAAPADLTLLVALPQAHRAFDTTQMAYRLQAHTLAYYRDHEWAATPPEMLQTLLVATLQRTRRFAAVLSSAYAGRPTHVLQTRLAELVQDFTGPIPLLRLSLQVQLVHALSRRAASREITVAAAMAQRSAEAGVEAANHATAQALREVAAFVLRSAA